MVESNSGAILIELLHKTEHLDKEVREAANTELSLANTE